METTQNNNRASETDLLNEKIILKTGQYFSIPTFDLWQKKKSFLKSNKMCWGMPGNTAIIVVMAAKMATITQATCTGYLLSPVSSSVWCESCVHKGHIVDCGQEWLSCRLIAQCMGSTEDGLEGITDINHFR